MRPLAAFAAALAALLCLTAFYPGESQLERLEQSEFDFFIRDGVAPADYAKIPSREQLIGVNEMERRDLRSAGCWPAAGKQICGTADARNGIVALGHYGCCESHAVLRYRGPLLRMLPRRVLTWIHTDHGFHLGSTSAEVRHALGAPRIFRDRNSRRVAYGYIQSGKRCPFRWIEFVFDAAGRVDGIEDSVGC